MSFPSLTLLWFPSSPFANKVAKSARFLGVPLSYEEEIPTDSSERLLATNPLSKIPALQVAPWPEAGWSSPQTIYDSAVICQVLDQVARREGSLAELLPAEGPVRWLGLRDEALCDGICEASVQLVQESRRPAELQSDYWQSRWEAAIWRALDALSLRLEEIKAGPALPRIALGCALDYLDLRHPERVNWRERYADLEQGTLRP